MQTGTAIKFACKKILVKSFTIVTVLGLASAAGSAEAPAFSTDISLAEIMDSIVMPAADILWNGVTYDNGPNGLEARGPDTDEGWAQLRRGAVALAGSSNLLLIPDTPIVPPGSTEATPEGELSPAAIAALQKENWAAWAAHSQVLHETAMQAIKAIDERNGQALGDIGASLDTVCSSCHQQFWYPEG